MGPSGPIMGAAGGRPFSPVGLSARAGPPNAPLRFAPLRLAARPARAWTGPMGFRGGPRCPLSLLCSVLVWFLCLGVPGFAVRSLGGSAVPAFVASLASGSPAAPRSSVA